MDLPPSKRNKLYNAPPNTGSCCITTVVSGPYQWYIPLFVYCIVKAYPLYQIKVYTRGDLENDLAEGYKDSISEGWYPDHPQDGLTTAALRFVLDDSWLKEFDSVLITDIDIMIRAELPKLVDQHIKDLTINGLGCYSNFVQQPTDLGMPGVHFVTKDWWRATDEARAKYREVLRQGAQYQGHDEMILGAIAKESGLPMPPRLMTLWNHHGIHLGNYRRGIEEKKARRAPNPGDSAQIKDLLSDNVFMGLVNESSKHLPAIGTIFDQFKLWR